MTTVKVCGITSSKDARLAVSLGASALGFVFYEKSPRYIAPDEAKEIIGKLPPFVTKVGVFVNADMSFLKKTKEVAGFDVYQLHGDETPEFCAELREKYIKAVRVKNAGSLSVVNLYDTDAFLLDSYSAHAYGGTGESFSWEILEDEEFKDKFIILSGGLNPQNVADAVRRVNPYAVDVSSGVEKSPGVKDRSKLKLFMEALRNGA